MNKEEIERITLEVNVELGRPCVAHYLNTFATRFIERIDAERGNPPLGYDAIFKSIASATKAPGAPAGIEVSVRAFKEAIGGEIFLSPTIQDEVSYHNAPGCLNTGDKAMWTIGWNACRDAMVAAQGERNAD